MWHSAQFRGKLGNNGKRQRPSDCRRPHLFPLKSRGLFALILLSQVAGFSCVRMATGDSRVTTVSAAPARDQGLIDSPVIHINNATADELQQLPGIGKALAARIVEYREKYGRFRRVEHLLMVRGVSERRFREMQPLITAD